MSESIDDTVNAYNGVGAPNLTDQNAPISVALFGSALGADWRKPFKDMPEWSRPVEFFDPRDTYDGTERSYIPELLGFQSHVRVMNISNQSYGIQSLLELGHLLACRLDTSPLAVFVDPDMDAAHADDPTKFRNSQHWRRDLTIRLSDQDEHPNLHIADSTEELLFITNALIANLQPDMTVE